MTYWFQFLSITSSFLVLNSPLVADAANLSNSASSVSAGLSEDPISFESPEGKGKPLFLYLSSDVENAGEPLPPPEEWPETEDRADFDFAHISSGGQILYVSSDNTEKTFQMVDGDPGTFYDFREPEDEAFFVVSLAETYPIYKASISTTYAIRRVEVWAFNRNPKEFFESGTDSSDSDVRPDSVQILSRRAPTARIDVPDDEDLTSLTIPLPDTTARYLLVRVIAKKSSDPIQVSMFSVFGNVPKEYLRSRNHRFSALRDGVLPPLPDVPQIPVASP